MSIKNLSSKNLDIVLSIIIQR